MNRKQTEAYLERIQYTGSLAHTGETLDRLIKAHIGTVPFENLDIYEWNLVPSLEEEDLYRKVVEQRRGGYCFELNTIFGALLKALGFPVYPIVVRLLGSPGPLHPYAHKGLIASAEGKRWYCDVGFGGPGPKGVVELRPGLQEIGGLPFRGRFREDGSFLIDRPEGEAWTDVMYFAERPIEPCDFLPLNFYQARLEESYFRMDRMVNLTLPNGSKALTGMHFTLRKDGKVTERDLSSKEEAEQLLREEYGIDVVLP